MDWLRNTFEISHSKHTTIRAMEGIRGLAAFLVFIVHYASLYEPRLAPDSFTAQVASYLHSMGDIGVDLFFVLSGYLIYGMLIKREQPFKSYFFKRIKRIYPTFIVVFIIYLFLSIIFPNESKIPSGWENAIVYIIQNFLLLPGLFQINPIITVSWSLSYEFFYYLFIPLLITALSLRSWTAQQRVIFFSIFSVVFFSYFAIYGGHIRLLMFVSGILLYETITNQYVKKVPPVGLISLLIAMFLVYFLKDIGASVNWKFFALYILFYLFCLECFVSSGSLSRFFSIAPIRWFGNMSYSYYLFHGITMNGLLYFYDKFYPASQDETYMIWILLLPVFLITLVSSSVLFIFVEKPFSLTRR